VRHRTSVRVARGQTTRTIKEAEAAVVRTIYERFAEGDGLRTIALALNTAKGPVATCTAPTAERVELHVGA
jgi:hypothetical protein